MFKNKLIVNGLIFAVLFSFALQISMFSISVSSRKKASGIVYAAVGVPVSGAIVTAVGSDGYGYSLTNLNGQYTITEGLKAGTYTVRVMKEGYLDGTIENVVVTVGLETSGVNPYLSRSGGVSGKITDNVTGFPIPNIAVMVIPSSGGMTYFGNGFSNIAGDYTVNMNLATGTYNVSIFYPEGYLSKTRGSVAVTAGAMTTGINLALQRSGIISGRITTPGGDPLANVTVMASSTGGEPYYGSDETNATGHYRIISGLGTGMYTVMAGTFPDWNFTDSVSVTAGSETSNINLQLSVTPPQPSGIIMGKVTDMSSKPIQGANVWAEGDTTMGYGDATTDENGNYIISEGLETDTYTVHASAHGYQTQNLTDINVIENEITTNVNFQLTAIPPAQSGRISGTVTGEENPIPEFQYPMAVMLALTVLVAAIAKSSSRKHKQYQTN